MPEKIVNRKPNKKVLTIKIDAGVSKFSESTQKVIYAFKQLNGVLTIFDQKTIK